MRLKRILGSIALSLLIAVQIPVAVLAEEVSPAPSPTPVVEQQASPEPTPTPTPTPAPVVKHPDKPGWVYNDGIGKWEAADLASFTWDDGLGRWDSPLYWFAPQVGWYHVIQAAPATASATTESGTASDGGTVGANGPSALAANDPANTNTGPGSTNNSLLDVHNKLLANLLSNINITNFDTSKALSGAANVGLNTFGGDATTGAATVVKNLFNLINSMWSWGTGAMNFFTLDIFGDHHGDININTPSSSGGGGSLGSLPTCSGGSNSNSDTGALSVNTATTNCQNDTTVNNRTSGSITNNVDLSAVSGPANVQGNTNGGDAISGNATAELNIVNMINSSIGANGTFFGIINIYGNLDGDILFPGLSLDDAIASGTGSTASNSNTGAGSNNDAGASTANNTSVNSSATGVFNNNIDAQATSGDANVSGNTNAGSASTGNASTNSSEFNLFNTDIFGDNAVLVIINDMGHWVGRIMNLPSGSTSGLATSNATVTNNNTGAGSTNNATDNSTNNTNVNNDADGTITNNVKATAKSGDANVQNNTNAGNAKTGDAKVASNIANIFGSHLSFKGIMGILFVNVFGTWTGSVGVDTAAGNGAGSQASTVVAAQAGTSAGNKVAASFGSAAAGGNVGGGNLAGSNGGSGVVAGSSTIAGQPTQVLAASKNAATAAQAALAAKNTAILFEIAAGIMLLAGAMVGIDRKLRVKVRA